MVKLSVFYFPNMITDFIQDVTIVAYKNYCTLILLEHLSDHFLAGQIQMIGRLVQ